MIWIIPLVLAAAAAYSLIWFLLNRKLSSGDEAENITRQTMGILSRSLFKRRGIFSGMTFTGQSRRLNQNENEMRPDLNRNIHSVETPPHNDEPESEPANPPSDKGDSQAPDGENDNPHNADKPSE